MANEISLKYRKKVIVIFIEYFVFSVFFHLTFSFFTSIGFTYFKTTFLITHLIYYSLVEFLFNKSLVMKLFKVELDTQNKMNLHFVSYMISSLFDRTLLIPFHILLAMMNYENLLLCEKLSGIKWRLKKHEHA